MRWTMRTDNLDVYRFSSWTSADLDCWIFILRRGDDVYTWRFRDGQSAQVMESAVTQSLDSRLNLTGRDVEAIGDALERFDRVLLQGRREGEGLAAFLGRQIAKLKAMMGRVG